MQLEKEGLELGEGGKWKKREEKGKIVEKELEDKCKFAEQNARITPYNTIPHQIVSYQSMT